jgi:hypothetical protein
VTVLSYLSWLGIAWFLGMVWLSMNLVLATSFPSLLRHDRWGRPAPWLSLPRFESRARALKDAGFVELDDRMVEWMAAWPVVSRVFWNPEQQTWATLFSAVASARVRMYSRLPDGTKVVTGGVPSEWTGSPALQEAAGVGSLAEWAAQHRARMVELAGVLPAPTEGAGTLAELIEVQRELRDLRYAGVRPALSEVPLERVPGGLQVESSLHDVHITFPPRAQSLGRRAAAIALVGGVVFGAAVLEVPRPALGALLLSMLLLLTVARVVLWRATVVVLGRDELEVQAVLPWRSVRIPLCELAGVRLQGGALRVTRHGRSGEQALAVPGSEDQRLWLVEMIRRATDAQHGSPEAQPEVPRELEALAARAVRRDTESR